MLQRTDSYVPLCNSVGVSGEIIVEGPDQQTQSRYLQRRGLIGPMVTQIDIASIAGRSICDHNCGIIGGYDCPARNLLPENKGLKIKDLTPAAKVMQSITVAVEGMKLFNEGFVSDGSLDRYGQVFAIPDEVRAGLRYNLQRNDALVNIFGGNAEMHPEVMTIARECRNLGFLTNLTTTGGVLLRTSSRRDEFLAGLLDGSVGVLAVTAEYKSGDEIRRLFQMTTAQLRNAWNQIPPALGQLRKGVETINVLKLRQELGNAFAQPLLNLVVHSGILGTDGERIEEIIGTLQELAPEVKINPYPAQSFSWQANGSLSFVPADVPALQSFITRRRLEQREENPHMVMRPHYFDMLESVVRIFVGDNETIARMLSGEDTWTCFEKRHDIYGSGSLVQVGDNRLSCFWDPTITRQDEQVSEMQAFQVARHIAGGMHALAQKLENPCKGCLMPRLNHYAPQTELGLLPILKPAYLDARKESVGY